MKFQLFWSQKHLEFLKSDRKLLLRTTMNTPMFTVYFKNAQNTYNHHCNNNKNNYKKKLFASNLQLI